MNAVNRWLDSRSETFLMTLAVVTPIVVVGSALWLAVWLSSQGVRP